MLLPNPIVKTVVSASLSPVLRLHRFIMKMVAIHAILILIMMSTRSIEWKTISVRFPPIVTVWMSFWSWSLSKGSITAWIHRSITENRKMAKQKEWIIRVVELRLNWLTGKTEVIWLRTSLHTMSLLKTRSINWRLPQYSLLTISRQSSWAMLPTNYRWIWIGTS